MKQCPLCGSEIPDSTLICDCGYDFEQEEITDWDKMRALLARKDLDWKKHIRIEKRALEIQTKKYGTSTKSPKSKGWSMHKLEKYIGISFQSVSRDIQIAKALDKYPKLSKCKTKEKAFARLKELERGIGSGEGEYGFEDEDELQEFIFSNWERTPFWPEWKLHKGSYHKEGKVDAGEVGIMDLLAKHETESRWLVIELKVNRSSDNAVGQVLRYMGWVKRNLARDEEVVEGLIISKSPDIKICYALVCTTNINYQSYILKNGKIQLTRWDIDNYAMQQALQYSENMTPEQRKDLRKKLEANEQ